MKKLYNCGKIVLYTVGVGLLAILASCGSDKRTESIADKLKKTNTETTEKTKEPIDDLKSKLTKYENKTWSAKDLAKGGKELDELYSILESFDNYKPRSKQNIIDDCKRLDELDVELGVRSEWDLKEAKWTFEDTTQGKKPKFSGRAGDYSGQEPPKRD